MEGMAYAFLSTCCGEPHDLALTCQQAAFVRGGRCPTCGLMHGNRTCNEARDILSKFTAAPAR